MNLSRVLSLEAPVRVPDGAGGFAESWEVLGNVWAEVVPGSGREVAGEDVSLGAVGYRITVRGAVPGSDRRPVPGQRFREGDRVFAVLAVAERDAAGRYLVCFAREEVSA